MLHSVDPGAEIDRIEIQLRKLLKQQEPIDSYFSKMSMGGHGPSKTPGPKPPRTPRPHIQSFSSYPAYTQVPHPPPPPPPLPSRPTSHIYAGIGEVPIFGAPTAQPNSHVYGGIGDVPIFVPPAAPSVPTSPTFSSASSRGTSSQGGDFGGTAGPAAHWARRIFDGRHTSTQFRTLGEPTECLGRDEPQAIGLLNDDGFEKILELPLEATNVWLRLYCRLEDLRARILFLTMDPDGTRRRYCFPLTGLKIIRKDSCLQLCRVNRKDGGLDLWARLRFPLYERTLQTAMLKAKLT